MPKAKLHAYNIDRIHRQSVGKMLTSAADIAHREGAEGAVILLVAHDGRTIVRSAGTLAKQSAALAELLRVTVRGALE